MLNLTSGTVRGVPRRLSTSWLGLRGADDAGGRGGVCFGVDAVGTTISNEQVGSTYNTNVFDLHAQLGLLYRITPHGRVQLEVRGTGARVVRRLGVRLGYAWFYNQLAVPR